MMEIKGQAVLEGQIAGPGFVSAAQPVVLMLFRYFATGQKQTSPRGRGRG
jgi:hypothetical protein